MENRAQKLDGPGMDALEMAAALKRMLAADNGELAQRLDGLLIFPLLQADNAMFFALFGCEIGEVRTELKLAPLEETREESALPNPSERLGTLVDAEMYASGCNYGLAVEKILMTNPELAREYREFIHRPTCPACHHANGGHEVDCGAPK